MFIFSIPGIYFYDSRAPELAKKLQPSPRGELEITDLNKCYLEENTLTVTKIPPHVVWFDTGTYDSLMEASLYVQKEQKRTGEPIANLESLAYQYGYINTSNLQTSATKLSKTSYGEHLKKILEKVA